MLFRTFGRMLSELFRNDVNLDVNLEVPLLCTRLTPMTRYDWNYTTTPQVNLNDRVLPFPRGIGLGGSTAVSEYRSLFSPQA